MHVDFIHLVVVHSIFLHLKSLYLDSWIEKKILPSEMETTMLVIIREDVNKSSIQD